MQNGLLLSSLRISNGFTQRQMANYLGVSLNTYKGYENESYPMNVTSLNLISSKFKISIDYLLKLTNKNTYNNNFKDRINYRFLSSELKRIRTYYGYTQESLGYLFKMSTSAIRNYENKVCLVNAFYLYCFAKKFDVSVDYLCGKKYYPQK